MKMHALPAAGILLCAGAIHSSADTKTEIPVKVGQSQTGDAPYRFNGVVQAGDTRGSGFYAWNKRTFFSAAHVVYSSNSWDEPPVWYPRVNADKLDEKSGIQSRGYYRWTNYADLVANGSAKASYGRDVILGFAFKKIGTGSPAAINTDGVTDLKKNIKTLITGYPESIDYNGKETGGYFLHKTGPVVRPYLPYSGNALTTTLVSTGPGNSGGPVWTRNGDKGWVASGVLVGGKPSETIVYAFSKDIKAMLYAATPVLKPDIEDPVSLGPVGVSSMFFPYHLPNNRPVKIPDGVLKWTTFRIGAHGFQNGSEVESVKVSLNISTKHRGDLLVVLEGPGGAQAPLHDEQGAGKNNLVLKNVDVSESFTGVDPNNTWFLRVQDRLTGDVATLNSILLEIAVKPPAPVTTP